jgi:hypothetical protein
MICFVYQIVRFNCSFRLIESPLFDVKRFFTTMPPQTLVVLELDFFTPKDSTKANFGPHIKLIVAQIPSLRYLSVSRAWDVEASHLSFRPYRLLGLR